MSGDEDFIRFRCPRCTHSLKANRSAIGRKMFCPACYQELTVPVESQRARTDVEPERLYGVDSAPRDTRQMTDRFDYSEIDCLVCGTKIAVRSNQIGEEVECPDCGTKALVTKEKIQANDELRARLNKSDAPIDPNAKSQIDPNNVYGLDYSDKPSEAIDALGHKIAPNDNRPKFPSVVKDGQFAAYCPLCATLQYVHVSQVGTKVKCPECERDFLVYKPSELAPLEHQSGAINFEGGTVYGVAGKNVALGPDGRAMNIPGAANPSDPRSVYYDPSADPNLVPVVCRLCGTLMHAPRTMIGQKKKCPDCETETLIVEPKAEKKREEETIEPVFTGGYKVIEAPGVTERFRQETAPIPPVPLPPIPTSSSSRLSPTGPTADPSNRSDIRNNPSSPFYAPSYHSDEGQPIPEERLAAGREDVRRQREKKEKRKKTPREKFAAETNPNRPIYDAFQRKKQSPPPIPTAPATASPTRIAPVTGSPVSGQAVGNVFVPDRQTPSSASPSSATSPALGSPRPYRRPQTKEEKTLAGLAALEKAGKVGFDGQTFDPDAPTSLPKIRVKKFRRGKRAQGKKGTRSRTASGLDRFREEDGGLVARLDENGNVLLTLPSPPSATMGTNLFSPLAAGLFWSHWIAPFTIGLIIAGLFYYLILPCLTMIQSAGLILSRGFAMIIVSASAMTAIFGVFWIRAVALSFFSTFFALAGGAPKVEDWMEDDLLDGLLTGGRLVMIVAAAILPAAITRFFVTDFTVTISCFLGSFFLFFPIILLSSLQVDYPVVPLTRAIFSSLFRRFGTWFLFYFWSLALLGLPIWGIFQMEHGTPQFILFFLVGSVAMPLYSVLLGRLGWVIEDLARE